MVEPVHPVAGRRRISVPAPTTARAGAGLATALRSAAWLALAVGVGWFVLLRWFGELPQQGPVDSPRPSSATVPAWIPVASEVEAAPSADHRAAAERLVVSLRGPGAIDGGEDVAVDCDVAAPAGARGWINVAFDPTVLTLADASARHEPQGAGEVRLWVDDSRQPTVAIQLQFSTTIGASGPTAVRISGGQFASADGRILGLGSLPVLQVVLRGN